MNNKLSLWQRFVNFLHFPEHPLERATREVAISIAEARLEQKQLEIHKVTYAQALIAHNGDHKKAQTLADIAYFHYQEPGKSYE